MRRRRRSLDFYGVALLLVGLPLLATGCGPTASRDLPGERVFSVNEPGWAVDEFSVSPDGRWIAVSAVSAIDGGFRLYVVDPTDGRAEEAKPTVDARAQVLIDDRPGTPAMEWSESSSRVRFPAKGVDGGGLFYVNPGRLVQHEPLLPVNSPWFEVSLVDGHSGALEFNDSNEARSRPVHLPPQIDPRLKVKLHSHRTFDLLDHERGDRRISTLRGYTMSLNLDTASISPDGQWIGITVGREAFGFKGARGFLIDRQTGRRSFLASWILRGLKWHPHRREVFGVSNERYGHTVLMRWRY